MALVSSDTLPASFSNAFERLRTTVNIEDARTFASTTMKDVWNAARRVEHQLEAKRSLRNFNRIQKFLAGIEQYSKVVEVLCNQTPYLPFIWVHFIATIYVLPADLQSRRPSSSSWRSVRPPGAMLLSHDTLHHHTIFRWDLANTLGVQIAQANLSALDKLIDAYAMIGEAMPRFDKLSAAFKDDRDFQQVLGQFYEDILEFHRRAYKFFRRRGKV